MQKLECGYQQYAWGKHGNTSKVAKMVGKSDDAEGRYAELWIGTHPSKPAKLAENGAVLKDTLSASDVSSGVSLLGGEGIEKYVEKYGKNIPFLLKVLSVDKALSIQAHPQRDHAKELHAKDPAHYPDANHKPELVVALTPYRALCCFRPLAEVAKNLQEIAPLKSLVKNAEEIIALAAASNGNDDIAATKAVLKAMMESIYAASEEQVKAALDEHLAALKSSSATEGNKVNAVFVMLAEEQYPGDVGCWMVYILNLVHLNPGDALFLAANEPHSYLSGDSVEIMACSDNVVRAGLTPKFKDVPTLIEMLTYRTDSLAESHFANDQSKVQTYTPPQWCDEFMLTSVRLNGQTESLSSAEVTLPSIGLGVVTEGKGVVNGVEVAEGDTFVLSHEACTKGVKVETPQGDSSSLILFIATVNKPSDAPSAKL